jgi:hypothetical protein
MTAQLCEQVRPSFCQAIIKAEFFDTNMLQRILRFEKLEQPPSGDPAKSCNTNLYFGFFFDGTKNNYTDAEETKTHSNIARLYDCYPGRSVPGVLPKSADWTYQPDRYNHFFRTYIPGVATSFKKVSDSGEGIEKKMGAATGYLGEARITWALLQAVNHVHRYFMKYSLVSDDEISYLSRRLTLSSVSLRHVAEHNSSCEAMTSFQKILVRLHSAVSQHWVDKKTGKPPMIDGGIVQKIHISIFGFSRGATQARAFTNWLMALCKLDAHLCGKGDVMTLGGFQVAFDFLGIFDSVASIGTGNTLGNSYVGKLFDGHGAWADAGVSLRVPGNIPCLHLVAAHELRRSFPLDSVSVGNAIPSNCTEIVFPGVHSDLGCGYAPGEQGRGENPDGNDMMARIPLLVMYRAARLSGVPLKLELANANVQQRFNVSAETITAFNSYIAATRTDANSLTAIMRDQQNFQMQWRLLRQTKARLPLENTPSFDRASNFDKNDLHSANLEFDDEIAEFNRWLNSKGKKFTPMAQDPGYDNDYEKEWEEIARWWGKAPELKPAITDFFDQYVHDSRAWFKLIPDNFDNEAEATQQLRGWEKRRVDAINQNAALNKPMKFYKPRRQWTGPSPMQNAPIPHVSDGLTDNQRNAAEEFGRTGVFPRMITTGREPFELKSTWYFVSPRGGYLRYRKIYAGADKELISKNNVEATEGTDIV